MRWSQLRILTRVSAETTPLRQNTVVKIVVTQSLAGRIRAAPAPLRNSPRSPQETRSSTNQAQNSAEPRRIGAVFLMCQFLCQFFFPSGASACPRVPVRAKSRLGLHSKCFACKRFHSLKRPLLYHWATPLLRSYHPTI